ncbi:hypothetical protein K461DRAFT_281015 [Myriangium duriaei CBS 260.36]|uniref:Uncharacterized protein n=1 Tax=Myriangium duriaei CBS 260.36 TaxID=1168546 RepID=A0A9P4ITN1_9PEZI|nr:hypothetical protein K461DRAFT_281015 [Myriangium duriaei CBS 260.36]
MTTHPENTPCTSPLFVSPAHARSKVVGLMLISMSIVLVSCMPLHTSISSAVAFTPHQNLRARSGMEQHFDERLSCVPADKTVQGALVFCCIFVHCFLQNLTKTLPFRFHIMATVQSFTAAPEKLTQPPDEPTGKTENPTEGLERPTEGSETGTPEPEVPENPKALDSVYIIDVVPRGNSLTGYQEVKASVQWYQRWLLEKAEIYVQDKINSKQIDSKDSLGQENFRAKVLTFFLENKSTWLAKTADMNSSHEIKCEKSTFHQELIKYALGGTLVPQGAQADMEKILQSLSESVQARGTHSEVRDANFFTMINVYTYDPALRRTRAEICTIGFSTTTAMREYLSNKSHVRKIEFKLNLNRSQYHFNEEIFRGVFGQSQAAGFQVGPPGSQHFEVSE